MRVALVGPYPLNTSRLSGGVQTSFFNLLDGLSSFDDVESHVLTFVPGAREARRVETGHASVLFLPYPERFNNASFFRYGRRALRSALDAIGPDIVHAQDATGHGYMALKAVRDLPVVVSVHGIAREELKHATHPVDKIRLALDHAHLERYCIRHARYLVQPSRYPEEYFGHAIRGKIVEVGYGIPDRFFVARPSPEAGRVLFVGTIIPLKRVLDLIEVFDAVRRTVPGAVLRIAGPATDADYMAKVHARVGELGLADAVTFLGSLSPSQLVDEYRRASVFVLTSGQENSPMVIHEAMAAGVPVVSTRPGGIQYLVDDGRTGFLADVADITGLATRISQLLQDEETRAAFGSAGQKSAEQRFRSVEVAARVREVYLLALSEARRESDA
jgi:glycosyltransferase involved in cell wall biosynthesis